MSERVIDVNTFEQYKKDMSNYAVFVNRRRSVPDIKDGLKIVHRRIIYAAFNDEKAFNNHNVKSASIVGTVLKKYHPHGDTAVYDSIKPMNNWFEIMLPLFDGKGNWGNFQGDGAAAMRYTETKLSEFAYECVIGDLKDAKNAVTWIPNFDGTCLEPEYLPAKIPLLLINGSFGIGVGLLTQIPKHNINEVIDATLHLMKHPNAEITLIPDQCMPCEIVDTDWDNISRTGKGKFTVRGIIEVSNYKGNPALIIKSTPDLVFLDNVTEKIDALIKDKKLPQIIDMIDDSDPDNMRFIIVLKKGSDPNFLRDIIYKNTLMEKSVSVNFEALDGIEPMRLSYKGYLQLFLSHTKEVKFRKYSNKLQYYKTRLHEKDAYIKALESGKIDQVISMIRKSKKTDEQYLVNYLVKTLKITDLQAEFILRSSIKSLSIGYLNKYKEDAVDCLANIKVCEAMLTNEKLIEKEIEEDLKYYKKKYGRPRNCRIISKAEVSNIPKGTFRIIITENNFIKKIAVNESIGSFRNDTPKTFLIGENEDNILIFDTNARVYKLPIWKIPVSDKNTNGTDVRLLIKNLTSNIHTVMYEPTVEKMSNMKRECVLVSVTHNGNIKALELKDFLSVPPSGIFFSKLDPGDKIEGICIVPIDLDVIVYSKNKALRMHVIDIPLQKRINKGMKSMSDGEVDGIAVIDDATTDIITITESGKINRIDAVALPVLGRNKAGSRVIKLNKTDSINAIYGLSANEGIRICTVNQKTYDIALEDIPKGSSASVGVKPFPMKGDSIIRCSKIMRQ